MSGNPSASVHPVTGKTCDVQQRITEAEENQGLPTVGKMKADKMVLCYNCVQILRVQDAAFSEQTGKWRSC